VSRPRPVTESRQEPSLISPLVGTLINHPTIGLNLNAYRHLETPPHTSAPALMTISSWRKGKYHRLLMSLIHERKALLDDRIDSSTL